MGRPAIATVAAAAAVALVAAGCGGDTTGETPGPTGPAATGASSLKGVCPDKIVIQTDWFAESEYGNYYQMLGPNYKIDTSKKLVSGDLYTQGADTGVDLEIRAGGPAIGYQQVSAQMYIDKSITFGQVSTDEAIQNSKDQPTVAVLAPLEISPIMIMWDKKTYPGFRTVVDVGQSDTKVLFYQVDTYMQYLIGAGILKQNQTDGSYDGGPTRWVTEDGKIAQAGFATSEPYIYKNELEGGKSYDVDLQLINDTGYPMYGQALTVRAGEKEKLAPCLERFVPIAQRALVDFIAGPKATNELIIKIVKSDKTAVWTYSEGLADFAVTTLKNRGLVANGPNSTIGDMEERRIQEMIKILTPIFTGQDKELKPGLKPSDLFTNEFVDTSIGLKG